MKISRDWLGDFIEWVETDPAVIADRMTRGMGEVDEVEEQGALLKHCVVGKILTLDKHPNADKLSVCTIETERGIKHVVCGGTNVRQGMLVAFAHVGATVLAGGKELVTLQKVKIRGEESEGMICAGEELGIEMMFPSKPADGERAIVDLSSEAYKVGTPLREALGLTDVIFHIDNHAITNRPDLFSHIGVARELVAMGLAVWKKKQDMPTVKFPATPPPFTLINDMKTLVPHYYGAVLSIPAAGTTPDWMKRRLEATGWRSINLVVDITNYVLMEVGMPLHAFDAGDFKGDLHIRMAKKGEKIKTLDKNERALPEGAVIISDDEGIFDLFGVMGGLRTSNKPTTKTIFLQAGIIDPVAVRKTVVQMGHRTDAATVYEKGVLPVTAETGLKRAIELFSKLLPGTAVASKMVTWGKEMPMKTVQTTNKHIATFTGAPITPAKIKKILTDLGCTVKATGDNLSVTPPAWRSDLRNTQDIVEEVARVYGYANIAPVMPDASILPPARETRLHALRDSLSESGNIEMLHLAFTGPEQCRKWKLPAEKTRKIENPIGEELSLMRLCLVPSLVETAARELKRTGESQLKTYETGHTFTPHGEKNMLCLVVAARGKTTVNDSPLLVAKTDMLRALQTAGYEATVRTAKPMSPYAQIGRNADIVLKGATIGSLFEIHPSLASSLGLTGRVATATVDLDTLLSLPASVNIAKSIPVFPAITFDETVPLTGKSTHEARIAKLRTIDPLLAYIGTVGFYEKDANRTITLRFTYRAADRTLTQEEVEKIHAKVLVELKKV